MWKDGTRPAADAPRITIVCFAEAGSRVDNQQSAINYSDDVPIHLPYTERSAHHAFSSVCCPCTVRVCVFLCRARSEWRLTIPWRRTCSLASSISDTAKAIFPKPRRRQELWPCPCSQLTEEEQRRWCKASSSCFATGRGRSPGARQPPHDGRVTCTCVR